MFPRQFGFFPYIFLVYLVMPIYYVSLERGWKAALGYTLILLFLLSYRNLFWYPAVKIFSNWLVVQLAIIVILTIWFSPYNLFLGFFPANFIGWYEKKWQFHRAYGAFTAVLVGTSVILAIRHSLVDILFILPFLAVMLISPFGIRSMYKRMELEKQLDQANEQIKELVKREERVRIARDLHDTLGHTLSLITLQSQLVQRLIEKESGRAKAEAKEIEKTSRSALKQVRELVSDMRANTIQEELIQMEQILTAAEIDFLQEGKIDFSKISPLQQNILALCLREAGTNIVKHSRAKCCIVTMQEEKSHLPIIVKDDGVGIADLSNVGNGLNGMKERLALIEGKLELISEKGTVVEFMVPVIMKQEEFAL
ncbi:sensor histidine kinase [Bacillus niameyensis]|uniref:sensor histidine kinase n=1 Tax=Bacillus niameyensis TaxID=1522308 RepID=UPI000781D71D|nr:sensor histidine kinase [Bacillus niameyensis]